MLSNVNVNPTWVIPHQIMVESSFYTDKTLLHWNTISFNGIASGKWSIGKWIGVKFVFDSLSQLSQTQVLTFRNFIFYFQIFIFYSSSCYDVMMCQDVMIQITKYQS